jgi:hypothetical protein
MTTIYKLMLIAICLSVAAPVLAADDLPGDVQSYIARRTGCNYWPSEPATDKLRRAEIARNVRELHCTTLNGDEAKLKARYSKKPGVLTAIAGAHDAMRD